MVPQRKVEIFCSHWSRSFTVRSLPGIAEKEGRPMDSEYYSKTLSGAPSVLGMGFPSTEHGKPCAKRRFRLPVNQDQLVIRPAEWKDLPDSKLKSVSNIPVAQAYSLIQWSLSSIEPYYTAK